MDSVKLKGIWLEHMDSSVKHYVNRIQDNKPIPNTITIMSYNIMSSIKKKK